MKKTRNCRSRSEFEDSANDLTIGSERTIKLAKKSISKRKDSKDGTAIPMVNEMTTMTICHAHVES